VFRVTCSYQSGLQGFTAALLLSDSDSETEVELGGRCDAHRMSEACKLVACSDDAP
jgi:hypothetical protein